MKVCTLLQTDNHISTPPLNFCRPDVLPAAQPTASKHWRPLLSWYHHWNKQLNYTGYRADWTALSWTAGWSLEAFCTIVSSDCVGSFSFSSESVLSVCGTLRRFSRCSSRLFCTNNQQFSPVQVASGHKTAVLLFLLQQVSVCPTMTPKSVPSFGEILPPPYINGSFSFTKSLQPKWHLYDSELCPTDTHRDRPRNISDNGSCLAMHCNAT